MYTSDTDRSLRCGLRYLAASIAVAAAGAIYEAFSHGVYSYYMIYAFMIPLLAGSLPNLLCALKGNNVGFPTDTGDCGAAALQLAAIVTLTAGSLIKGVLDIYGTTSSLTIVYPLLGIGLLIAALTVFIVRSRSNGGEI